MAVAAEPETAYEAIAAQAVRSVRDVDHKEEPARLSVRFTHRRPRPPLASLTGVWSIVVQASGGCLVVLDHDFSAVDGAEETLLGIEREVEVEAAALLEAVRDAAEAARRRRPGDNSRGQGAHEENGARGLGGHAG